jgi:heat shock protein HslJ
MYDSIHYALCFVSGCSAVSMSFQPFCEDAAMQATHFAALLLAVVLGACSAPGAATPQPATPGAADPLAGTSWVLASIDGAAPLPGAAIRLAFRDGAVAGFAGCNSLGGPYRLEGATLRLTEVAQTAMACESAALMGQERAFTEALWATESYALQEGGALELRDGAGTARLIFQPEAGP